MRKRVRDSAQRGFLIFLVPNNRLMDSFRLTCLSNASYRKYRRLAKAQDIRLWPFQLKTSAAALQPVFPRKEQYKHLALVWTALLQQLVPNALQDPAEDACYGQQGCQNIQNWGVSHLGVVKMLSHSWDQGEHQQHWRASIHHLLLPAEECKPHSFVNLTVLFFFFSYCCYDYSIS